MLYNLVYMTVFAGSNAFFLYSSPPAQSSSDQLCMQVRSQINRLHLAEKSERTYVQ